MSAAAAPTTAQTEPCWPMTATAPYWALPENTSSDMATGASTPIPTEAASAPNAMPSARSAAATGSTGRTTLAGERGSVVVSVTTAHLLGLVTS